MKRVGIRVNRLFFFGLIVVLFLSPSLVVAGEGKDRPEPVTIQTLAEPDRAYAGGNERAVISVVVTGERGEPLSDLGEDVGDGWNPITLPAGWSLRTIVVPSLGCLFTPVAFRNGGFDSTPGAYLLFAVPFTNNPNCEWKSGEYHYVVQIDTSTPENPGLQGSALGRLVIP